jgi:hypothetical protein
VTPKSGDKSLLIRLLPLMISAKFSRLQLGLCSNKHKKQRVVISIYDNERRGCKRFSRCRLSESPSRIMYKCVQHKCLSRLVKRDLRRADRAPLREVNQHKLKCVSLCCRRGALRQDRDERFVI